MVLQNDPPFSRAIPIDQVLSLAAGWGYPVSLQRAKLPRAGYRTHVGLMWLGRLGSDSSSLPDSPNRAPSARLVITRRGTSVLTTHLSALRLAPKNIAVSAGMVGAGLDVRAGRVAAEPFIEVGATVEGGALGTSKTGRARCCSAIRG